MNKNLIIGLVVVGAVVIVGVALIGNKANDNQNGGGGNVAVNGEQQESTSEKEVLTKGKTLKDAMNGDLGDNVKCEVSYVVGDNNRLDGVTYISGRRIRVDYVLKDEVSGQKDLHMISDGEYGYVWGDSFLGETMQGSKFKLNMDESEEESETPENAEMIDYDVPVISCEPWNPDADLFKIPGDVDFIDMEEMQENMNQSVENMGAGSPGMMNCDFCKQLPEDQKASCLESMNCEEEE